MAFGGAQGLLLHLGVKDHARAAWPVGLHSALGHRAWASRPSPPSPPRDLEQISTFALGLFMGQV